MTEPFKLEARAKGPDDSFSPFKLTVSEPTAEDTGEFGCFLDCSFLGFEQHKVYGATTDQSKALALWLVEDQLKHHQCTLVDDADNIVELPIDRDAGVPGKPVVPRSADSLPCSVG